ncbi:MAG: porin [Gammaproteobacteria bacterium]|nr:porin [Gammaproteobacteria bacterium]
MKLKAKLFITSLLAIPIATIADASITLGGRLQADYLWVDEDVLEHRDGYETRRARLYLSGNLDENFYYKAQYDFTGDGEWKDLYIGYSGFENSYLQVGQIYEMVGLEGYTSSKNLTFIERSLPVAFVPDRALGVSITHWIKSWMFAAGYYGQNLRNTSDDSNGFSARAAWSQQSENNVIHLGASFAQRSPDMNFYRVRTRPESHVTDTRLVDTGTLIDVESYQTHGLEFAWVDGRYSLQSEYTQQAIERLQNSQLDISSWYVSGSYFLTHDSRNYSQKYGIFSTITPNEVSGAWELGVRYSEMDLNDGTLLGGQMKNWTLGLNYYLSKNSKLVLNYINSKANKNGIEDNPKFLQLRYQYVFKL